MTEPTFWRSRPVFITSTFRDMQAERDWLVAEVFPALEARLLERFHHLEVVDLRWGVDSASTDVGEREAAVLTVCLGEIRRSRPFLVALLGDRYGWRPPPAQINQAARETGLSEDVTGKSVTELEILFGVLADTDQHRRSWIYLRDPLPYERMGADAARYSDEYSGDAAVSQSVENLRQLKERLKAALPERVRTYPARWDPVNRAVAQADLKAWGDQVLKDLWSDLEAETAAFVREAPRTWQGQDRWVLDEFIEGRARGFIGRGPNTEALLRVALSPVAEDVPWGVCVTSAAGGGKSALFGHMCRLLQRRDVVLLAHAAGINVRSTQVDFMLRRWVEDLAAAAGESDSLDVRSTPEDVDLAFSRLLHLVAQTRRVVVIVDALDQFEATPRGTYLTWLPKSWPANARLIATAIPGKASEVLLQRSGASEDPLPPLVDITEARSIVRGICSRYHRTLNRAVENALLAKRGPGGTPAFGNPLWLEIATEELNLLDTHAFDALDATVVPGVSDSDRVVSMLCDVVDAMPGDTPGLYGFMLDRAERHLGLGWTRAFVNTIAISRGGWRESDFAKLLPGLSGEPGAMWDPLRFASVRRAFRGHVVQGGANGQWNFAHEQMRVAVTSRPCGSPPNSQAWHSRLSDHLERLPPNDPLARTESMFHLIHANDPHRAARFYVKEIRESADTLWALKTRDASWGTLALNEYIAQHEAEGIAWVASLCDQSLPESEDFALTSAIVVGVAGGLAETSPIASGILLQMSVNHVDRRWRAAHPAYRDRWGSLLHESYTSLGNCAIAVGRAAEAERWFGDALAIAEAIASGSQPSDLNSMRIALSHAKYGDLWMRLARDPRRAISHYIRALAIAKKAGRTKGEEAWLDFECQVAECQLAMGELRAATDTFESAYVAALERTVPGESRAEGQRGRDVLLGTLEEKLGNIALRTNDPTRAWSYYQRALDRRLRLLDREPGRLDFARAVAVAYSKLGDACLKTGDLNAADRAYQEDLRVTRSLWTRAAERSDLAVDLVVTCHKLARLRSTQGRLGEAKAYLLECRGILGDLVRRGVALDDGMRQLWAIFTDSRPGGP